MSLEIFVLRKKKSTEKILIEKKQLVEKKLVDFFWSVEKKSIDFFFDSKKKSDQKNSVDVRPIFSDIFLIIFFFRSIFFFGTQKLPISSLSSLKLSA